VYEVVEQEAFLMITILWGRSMSREERLKERRRLGAVAGLVV